MKRFFSTIKKSPTPSVEDDEPIVLSLKQDLERTRYDLETAFMGFDNATDPELIDSYIYEVNSVMERYHYLLHQAALGQKSSVS